MGRFNDEFEVICIGALYQGKWERRYWSNFRAKNKYPFPVGYKAKRMYDGRRFTMEIREGLRGPIFEVTSQDGFVGSGETATTAWKNALSGRQRWQNILFSTYDGLELFGFKHQVVQRLLQDLPVENPAYADLEVDHPCKDEQITVAHESDLEDIKIVARGQDDDDQLVSRTARRASEGAFVNSNVESDVQLRGSIKRKQKLYLQPRKQKCMETDLCEDDGRSGTNQLQGLLSMENMNREPGKSNVEGFGALGISQGCPQSSGSGDAAQHRHQRVKETRPRHEMHRESNTSLANDLQSSKRQLSSSDVEYMSSQGDVYLRSRSRLVPIKRFKFEVAPDRRNKLGMSTTLQSDEEVDLEIDTESEDIEDQQATNNVCLNSESQLSIGQQVTRDMVAIWFPQMVERKKQRIETTSLENGVRSHLDVQVHQEEEIIPSHASPMPTKTLSCDDGSDQQGPLECLPQLDTSEQHEILLRLLRSSQKQDPELEGSVHNQLQELKTKQDKHSLSDQRQSIPGVQTANGELCMQSFEVPGTCILFSPAKQGSALKDENAGTEDASKVREDWWNTVSPSELYSSQELLEVAAGCQNDGCSAPVMPSLHDPFHSQSLKEGLEKQQVRGAVALHNLEDDALHSRASDSLRLPLVNRSPQNPTGHLPPHSVPQAEIDMCSRAAPVLSTGLLDPLTSCDSHSRATSNAAQKNNHPSACRPIESNNTCMGEQLTVRHPISVGDYCSGHVRDPDPGSSDGYECGSSGPNKHLSPELMDLLPNHAKQFDWENRQTSDVMVENTGDRTNFLLGNKRANGFLNCESSNLCQPPEVLECSKTLVVPEIRLESSTPTCIGHISHPLPVRSMWLTGLENIVQLCVSCSASAQSGQTLFIYRTQQVENDDVEFILWTSFFINVRSGVDDGCDLNEQGVAFFPNGAGLVMLSYLGISQEWDTSNSPAEKNALQVLGFNSQEVWLQSQLNCATEMQCISVPQSQLIIAAAASGEVNCWEMDAHWKLCQESFLLPNANVEAGLSTVSQLLTIPGFGHLIVGCYSNGTFAIWDHRLRVLLRSFQGLQPAFGIVKANTLLLLPSATAETTPSLDTVYETEYVVPAKNLGLYGGEMNLCFLVQTRSHAESHHKESGSVECRYAILRGDAVVFTGPFDDSLGSRASAASVVGPYTVFGTHEGETFLVDTLSGKKVLSFQDLEGSCIKSVVTDPGTRIFAAATHSAVAIYA